MLKSHRFPYMLMRLLLINRCCSLSRSLPYLPVPSSFVSLQDPADSGSDLPNSNSWNSGRESVRRRTDHVHLQHHAARLQPGLLWQGVPHIAHPLLGLSDHPGVHAEPVLHHVFCSPVCQSAWSKLFSAPFSHGPPRARSPRSAPRPSRSQTSRPQHQRHPGAPRKQGRSWLGRQGDPQWTSRGPSNAQKRKGAAAGRHLPFLRHPGGVPQRARNRLLGRPILPVRLQRSRDVWVWPLPLCEGGGVLRVSSNGKNGLPGLYVCRKWHMCGAQPGWAQPPWMEEDKDGHARCAGPKEVHLRSTQEGRLTPVPGPKPGQDPVQWVSVCLTEASPPGSSKSFETLDKSFSPACSVGHKTGHWILIIQEHRLFSHNKTKRHQPEFLTLHEGETYNLFTKFSDLFLGDTRCLQRN